MSRPSPSQGFNPRYGWLLPSGKFYACEWQGHYAVALEVLGAGKDWEIVNRTNWERKAELAGWLKIGRRDSGSLYFAHKGDLTQRQRDWLWSYCQHHCVDFSAVCARMERV